RTMAAYGRPMEVQTKDDQSPVTATDRAVEELIRRQLEDERVGDAVVGEELGRLGFGRRTWIVDPIDGTANFIRGIPVWATLLALDVVGVVEVGVVSAPALGRRWWAARGRGALAGPPGGPGEALSVSDVRSLGEAQLSYPGTHDWDGHGGAERLVELAALCKRDRGFGDFWSHCLVAEGACDIALDPVVSLWDLAALQVIVEEAGGRFTDLAGVARADGGSAISSNGHLHEAALAVLRGAGG
ncbi:MAG: inositol monophosphatase family protein, partial [Acidimicrobiales bacterium]